MNIFNSLLFRFKWWWYRDSLPSEGEEGFNHLKQAYLNNYELNVLSYDTSSTLIIGPILFIYITICGNGKYGYYHSVLILSILAYILYTLLSSFQKYSILNWEDWLIKQILPKEQYTELANFKNVKLDVYRQDVAIALMRRYGRLVSVLNDAGDLRVEVNMWKPDDFYLQLVVWANPVYLWAAFVLGDTERTLMVNVGVLVMAGIGYLLYDFKERGEKLLQELLFYEQNKIHRLDLDAKARRGRELIETFRHRRYSNSRKIT